VTKGHSDNRYTASSIGSKGTNFTQQLEAVHFRHLMSDTTVCRVISVSVFVLLLEVNRTAQKQFGSWREGE
jgi:hypothetical protein